MSGWNGLSGDGGRGGVDFMSLYISKSCTPNHKMNGNLSELTFSPSPTKAPSTDSDAFCRHDNVENCVLFLNQEVTTLGMPSLYEGTSSSYDTVRLVNCLHDLLQRHQRSARLREELENRLHRLESDESHYRLVQGRLKASLEQSQRELAKNEEKVRQLTNKNKLLTNKLKAEKEEVRRLQSEGNHRYTQFKHDLNKKEREATKLKERLNQLLSDKCQEKKIGMEISEVIQRTDGKRGTWQKRNKQDEEMHREVISNYEHRQKELMVENSGLRQCLSACLSTLQKELVTLFNDNSTSLHHTELCVSDEDDDDLSIASDNASELTDAHFEMPYDFMRENLEKNMMEKCRRLKKYIKRVAKSKSDCESGSNATEPSPKNEEKHQKDMERLHKQIDRYREIIDQQEQLIQQGLISNSPTEPSSMSDSQLLEDRESLDAERKLFKQQKANFEEERRIYTDAAIRLGREKTEDDESDMEVREIFEKERSTYLTQQILQMSPFHNKPCAKMRSQSPEGTHLLPATTTFSPAPTLKTGLATPSTADLYRTLGLPVREARNQHASACASPALKRSGAPSVTTTSTSPSPSADQPTPTSARSSPGHRSRISEHAHNVKMAVFSRESTNAVSGSPDDLRSPHS